MFLKVRWKLPSSYECLRNKLYMKSLGTKSINMSDIMIYLAMFSRTGEKAPDTSDNDQVDRLTMQVEQTNLEIAKQSPNNALDDIMEGWKVKGAPGDTCPRSLMATACSVVEYPPAVGKGYFVLPGDRLQASMSELVKSKPWEFLKGPKGCGYWGCRSSFF